MRVSWDLSKAAFNWKKHRVSFEEAATVFLDPLALITLDSIDSTRTVTIGESARRRVLYVVAVEYGDNAIRVVSARRAAPSEMKRYEEGEKT